MSNFQEMFIPCTEAEYPEVKRLLEGMGCRELRTSGVDNCEGVTMYSGGYFQALNDQRMDNHPTVTLPELRAMALPQKPQTIPQAIDDELRLLKDRVGIMERSVMGMESKINVIHYLLIKQ